MTIICTTKRVFKVEEDYVYIKKLLDEKKRFIELTEISVFETSFVDPVVTKKRRTFVNKKHLVEITSQEAEKQIDLIKMDDFLRQNPEISVRLRNILKTKKYLGDGNYSKEYIFPYINYVNKRDFLRLRNAGARSWNEIDVLMKKFGIKPQQPNENQTFTSRPF